MLYVWVYDVAIVKSLNNNSIHHVFRLFDALKLNKAFLPHYTFTKIIYAVISSFLIFNPLPPLSLSLSLFRRTLCSFTFTSFSVYKIQYTELWNFFFTGWWKRKRESCISIRDTHNRHSNVVQVNNGYSFILFATRKTRTIQTKEISYLPKSHRHQWWQLHIIPRKE